MIKIRGGMLGQAGIMGSKKIKMVCMKWTPEKLCGPPNKVRKGCDVTWGGVGIAWSPEKTLVEIFHKILIKVLSSAPGSVSPKFARCAREFLVRCKNKKSFFVKND